MRRTLTSALAAFALAGLVLGPAVAGACVGKTLYVGKLPGAEQEILAEIFVWLVSERTGTSIEIKSFPDSRSTHTALEEAKIDLYLEETGVALMDILGRELSSGEDAAALRGEVKTAYEEQFNFIWLEPWGLSGASSEKGGELSSSLVAPVVRKDTLKKFPALSRLVNKLAGVIDDAAMAELVLESAGKPAREVTKTFLKKRKLI